MKILVVEDDPHVAEIVIRILKQAGHSLHHERDGKLAYTLIKQNSYDLVLLDVMLPTLNGNEILTKIRNKSINTPVIMLTAIGTHESIVENLNNGADDYISKPFKVDELLARVNAVARRGNISQSTKKLADKIYKIDHVTLNDTTKIVSVQNNSVSLTQKEFNLLRFLFINQGKILSREQILENVWGIDFQIGTNVVDVYINYLRKKIQSNKKNPIIETVIGMGYIVR